MLSGTCARALSGAFAGYPQARRDRNGAAWAECKKKLEAGIYNDLLKAMTIFFCCPVYNSYISLSFNIILVM